ncbi:uncharacterized protein LOC113147130 [Cyclospora cayetanensis]|uniref:Uncharacterized protein LOC113147130 n=1 Tax=Cyclospora cayetanensis TaxID=88456 RepID=A0A6P6RY77_9EIME|nr:uncharacterized protein LOC113147130 [Cyclospora cayetanensis]
MFLYDISSVTRKAWATLWLPQARQALEAVEEKRGHIVDIREAERLALQEKARTYKRLIQTSEDLLGEIVQQYLPLQKKNFFKYFLNHVSAAIDFSLIYSLKLLPRPVSPVGPLAHLAAEEGKLETSEFDDSLHILMPDGELYENWRKLETQPQRPLNLRATTTLGKLAATTVVSTTLAAATCFRIAAISNAEGSVQNSFSDERNGQAQEGGCARAAGCFSYRRWTKLKFLLFVCEKEEVVCSNKGQAALRNREEYHSCLEGLGGVGAFVVVAHASAAGVLHKGVLGCCSLQDISARLTSWKGWVPGFPTDKQYKVYESSPVRIAASPGCHSSIPVFLFLAHSCLMWLSVFVPCSD